jgi:shikimate kinase
MAAVPGENLNSKRIFLWGMMGAGKTTLGAALAAQLQLPFIDLDREIEHHHNQTIGGLFAELGEEAFRMLETRALHRLLQAHNHFVMATGGGTPCYGHNLETMRQAGIAVWLDVPTNMLAARLWPHKDQRPLLRPAASAGEMRSILNQILDKRRTFYDQAHLKLAGGSVNADQIVDALRRNHYI